MNTLLTIILANAIIGSISLCGVFLLIFNKKNQAFVTQLLVSFAAGVLLASAFLSILHEALENQEAYTILVITLIGITYSFTLERMVFWFHHHDDTHNIHPSAYLVLIGDGIHNFVDGLALAATFMVSPVLGITTAFAIVAHELPQEIADFSILRHAGFTTKNALLFNFISALTAIIGGVVGYFAFQSLDKLLPYALAFTAGIFIYISAADLIPALHEKNSKLKPMHQLLPFIIGIVLIYILTSRFSH
jgi:zinc and cadmium transporter